MIAAADGAASALGGSLAVAQLEQIYVGRRGELIRVLVNAGTSEAEAEDIAQEVFLRTLLHIRDKALPENLFAWLVASAKHAVVDHFRRHRREVAPTPVEWAVLEDRTVDDWSTADGGLLERERFDSILRAIESLAEIERRCVLLRSEGVKFREIADQLGIPLRTAAYHTSTAIEKLQRRVRI